MRTKLNQRTAGLLCAAVLFAGPAIAQVDLRDGQFTTSDGVELHYLHAGSGPVIVFVPGWTMPAWIWDHQIQHFAKNHRVIAFDPRGQGESEKPPFGYDHARRARDIAELVDHLDSEPIVLVGWSLGVFEVVKYLEQHGSSAVRAAVLVDWAMHYDDPARFTGRYISLQTEREEWTRRFVKAIFRSSQSDAYLEKVTQAALSTPTNAAAILFSASGLVIGGLIGVALDTERWRDVPLENVRMAVVPHHQGGLSFGARLTF